MRQWKNFENRSIFGKDIDKSLWLTFLGHPVSRSGWCVCTRRSPKPCCWSTVVSTSTCWSAASWTDHSGQDTSLINFVSVSLLNAEFIDVSSSWTLFYRRQPVMFYFSALLQFEFKFNCSGRVISISVSVSVFAEPILLTSFISVREIQFQLCYHRNFSYTSVQIILIQLQFQNSSKAVL